MRILALALIGAVLIPIGDASANDCDQIRDAVDSMNLPKFKGEFLGMSNGKHRYKSNFHITGTKSCVIREGDDNISMVCLADTVDSETAATDTAIQWSQIVGQCLPEFQTAPRNTRGFDVTLRGHTDFPRFHINVIRDRGNWVASMLIDYD